LLKGNKSRGIRDWLGAVPVGVLLVHDQGQRKGRGLTGGVMMSAKEETKGERHAGCLSQRRNKGREARWLPAAEFGPRPREKLGSSGGKEKGLGPEEKGRAGPAVGRMGWAFGCWASRPRVKKRGGRRGPSGQNSGGRVFRFSFVFF